MLQQKLCSFLFLEIGGEEIRGLVDEDICTIRVYNLDILVLLR